MDDQERSQAHDDAQPSHDRRRGPRRRSTGTIEEDRRQNERRNTPGIPKLLDDILNASETGETGD